MNRRMKVRGKRINNDEWAYGYLTFIIKDSKSNSSDKANIYDQENCENYTVWIRTLGQFTGLTDKNGKEIYEGDICWDSDWKTTFEIFWCKDSLAWKVNFVSDGDTEFLQECTFDNERKQIAKTVEIISSIHDKPKGTEVSE